MVMSDFRPEVEIWPFDAWAMHRAIIVGTVGSLWTWLWGRYHVPQNVLLFFSENQSAPQNANPRPFTHPPQCTFCERGPLR